MGRHPLQTGNMIKPEIGKLPKSVVDCIPLVIYIPPPPDGLFKDTLAVPEPAHAYPPKSPALSVPESRKRFRFIRKLSSHAKNKSSAHPGAAEDVEKAAEPQTWEEHWEKGEYPFVVLQGNRAACAICLMDFEEPKRMSRTTTTTMASASLGVDSNSESENTCALEPVISVTQHDDGGDELKLADAGEGVQPLRLLECGHVFHVRNDFSSPHVSVTHEFRLALRKPV